MLFMSHSRRSGKNKRKLEARKWSTKFGSKYEEIGLMKEITQSIELGQRLASKLHLVAVSNVVLGSDSC